MQIFKIYVYILCIYDLDLNEKKFVCGTLNEFHSIFINGECTMYQD